MKSTIQKLRSMISVIAISLILSSFTTSTARVETSFGTTIMGVPSGSKTFTFWGNNYISVSIGNNSSIPVIAFYECLQLQKGEEYIVLPPYRHTMGTPFYVDVPEHELPFLWVFKFDASYYERRHSRHRTCKGTCRHSGNRKKNSTGQRPAKPNMII